MAETLLTVRTEVLAGGFNRLGATVIDRLINDAYTWVVGLHLWPFRQAIANFAGPSDEIDDLGVVGAVLDVDNNRRRLEYRDMRTLEESVNLQASGVPRYWYFTIVPGVIAPYPVGGTLEVHYWKAAAPLVEDEDELIVPDRWVQVVIDKARHRACLRLQDWSGANALRSEVLAEVDEMRMDLLAGQASDPDQIVVYGGEGR